MGINDFKNVTDSLNIYPNELGAVMLDFEPVNEQIIPEEWCYYTSKQDLWWVKGWVGSSAHLTLKYGFLKKAYELKDQINALIGDIALPHVEIEDATVFAQPDADYVVIILRLLEDPTLLELNRRLSYLPHIDTFTPWLPHVTMAYVKAEYARQCMYLVTDQMSGRILAPKGLNLGENH